MLLNPYPPEWYSTLHAMTLFVARRYEEAIVTFERISNLDFWDRAYLAACYGQMDRLAKAQAQVAACLALRPGASLIAWAANEPYRNPVERDHLLECLRKAGVAE
jgi:hypothetical protein